MKILNKALIQLMLNCLLQLSQLSANLLLCYVNELSLEKKYGQLHVEIKTGNQFCKGDARPFVTPDPEESRPKGPGLLPPPPLPRGYIFGLALFLLSGLGGGGRVKLRDMST